MKNALALIDSAHLLRSIIVRSNVPEIIITYEPDGHSFLLQGNEQSDVQSLHNLLRRSSELLSVANISLLTPPDDTFPQWCFSLKPLSHEQEPKALPNALAKIRDDINSSRGSPKNLTPTQILEKNITTQFSALMIMSDIPVAVGSKYKNPKILRLFSQEKGINEANNLLADAQHESSLQALTEFLKNPPYLLDAVLIPEQYDMNPKISLRLKGYRLEEVSGKLHDAIIALENAPSLALPGEISVAGSDSPGKKPQR